MQKANLVIAIAQLILATTVYSQLPGDLDPTFNSDGTVTTNFGSLDEGINAVAIQADDRKIVVAGFSFNGADHDFALARYNWDGSLDAGFGTDGILTTSFGSGNDIAYSVALQPDGKIVVAGASDNGSDNDFALARYNSDGTLDAAFGIAGKLTTNLESYSEDEALAIAIQADGKIVIAGRRHLWAVLLRYHPNGDLDNSFGSGGIVRDNAYASAYSIAIQPDGKIVAGGYSADGPTYDFALARYNSNGTLDNSFSTDGGVVTDFSSANDIAHAVALQSDGKIVAAGSSGNSDSDFALARYNANGTLDNSFSFDGKVLTDIRQYDDTVQWTTYNSEAYSVAIQPDGKIIAAGASRSIFSVARYNPDGTLDGSFSNNGVATADFNTNTVDFGAKSYAVIQPDGKIVTAGSLLLYVFNGVANDFALARYNSDGTPDNTFSGDGKIITSVGNFDDHARSAILLPDRKIVAAGYSYMGRDSNFALACYNTNGTLYGTFGEDGKQVGFSNDIPYSVTAQQDGKIVAAGYSYNGTDKDFAVWRYHAFGLLDDSLSRDGKLTTAFGSHDDAANAVVMQPDGKIAAGGYSSNGTSNDFALARYAPNGALDNSFSADGKLTTEFGSYDDEANALIVQPDGKILAAGGSGGQTFAGHPFTNFALARYNADGTLDNDFGNNGKLTTAIGAPGRNRDYANSALLQHDGKIVAAGSSFNGTNNDFVLVRYNADGSLDNSFSNDGIVTTDFGPGDDAIYSIALQTDGKIAAAGISFNGNDDDFALAVFNADGTLDNSFGTGGKLTTDFSMNDIAYSVIIQPGGEIVAAGSSFNGKDYDFALARYLSSLNVGIIDFSAVNNSAIVYPNPIAENATIEYILSSEEEISIHLLDMQGKSLKTFISQQRQEAGVHRQRLSLPDKLAAGSYFILISSPRGRIRVGIIK